MSFVKAQFVLPAGAARAPRSLGDFRKANFILPVPAAQAPPQRGLGNFIRASFVLPAAAGSAPRRALGCLGCPGRSCGGCSRRGRLGSLGVNWGALVGAIGSGIGTAENVIQAFKTPQFTPQGQVTQQPQAQLQPAVYVQPQAAAGNSAANPVYPNRSGASSSTILGMKPTTLALAGTGVALVIGLIGLMKGGGR